MNTPDIITDLRDDEIFVFGSNKEGRHIAGAARLAADAFGAEWGVGEGITGRCYAVPTMSGMNDIKNAVAKLLYLAARTPEKTFLVTRIGCGIAGYTPEQIAPLFVDAPTNVVLPLDFTQVIA